MKYIIKIENFKLNEKFNKTYKPTKLNYILEKIKYNFKNSKYAKCINNKSYNYTLTLNNLYEIIEENPYQLLIKTDTNKTFYINKCRFEIPTPKEIEKHELNININKYNL